MGSVRIDNPALHTIKDTKRVQENCFKLWLKNLTERHRIGKRINESIGKSESAMLFQPNVSCCHPVIIAGMINSLTNDAVPENIQKISLKEYEFVKVKKRRGVRSSHMPRIVKLEVVCTKTKKNYSLDTLQSN